LEELLLKLFSHTLQRVYLKLSIGIVTLDPEFGSLEEITKYLWRAGSFTRFGG